MRLLFCEVENYGKIAKRKISFGENTAQFCEENGYGKTTLCSFLRVMFYGMETHREKDATFGDREHFYPFDGGKFGGSLTFLRGEKTCRIERFFDKKSQTKDTFKYYEDGEEISCDGATIGKEMFGVDEKAFERSLFFDAQATEISATDGMREKLVAIAEGTDVGSSAADAIEYLEKKRKEIRGDKKSAKCEIYRIEEEGREINGRIDALRTETGRLDECYAAREKLQEEIAAAEKRCADLQAQREKEAKKETYDAYLKKSRAAAEKRAEIEKNYPAGMMSDGEIESLRGAIERKKSLETTLLIKREEEQKKEGEWKNLHSYFSTGVPTEEILQSVEEDIEIWRKYSDGLSKKSEISQKEKVLLDTFDGSAEEKDAFFRAANLCKEYRSVEREIAEEQTRLLQERSFVPAKKEAKAGEKSAKNKNFATAMLVLGALSLLGGVAACFLSLLVGGAIAAAGAACLIIGAISLKRGGAGEAQTTSEIAADTGRLTLLTEEKERLRGQCVAFLSGYGYEYSDLSAGMDAIGRDYADFCDLCERMKKEKEIRAAAEEEIKAKERAFAEFFTPYKLQNERDYLNALHRLRVGIEKYAESKKALLAVQEEIKTVETQKKNVEAEALRLLSVRLISPERFTSFEQAAREIEAEKKDRDRYEREERDEAKAAREYAEKQGLGESVLALPSTADESAVKESREILSDLTKSFAEMEREISDLESKAEKLEEYYAKRADNQARYDAAEARRKLYVAAIEAMKRADESLVRRYVEPVKNGFVSYAKLIEEKLSEKVELNRDFSLSFVRGGEKRKDGHLSAGLRSVCAFCLRLALIDEMFKGKEQPFLVLDDPFVHLDEKHFADTADLIRQLSKDRQFVYFTCHESRKIGG